jgi:hypothetical protein
MLPKARQQRLTAALDNVHKLKDAHVQPQLLEHANQYQVRGIYSSTAVAIRLPGARRHIDRFNHEHS